ncbi:MAG: hypothetical protein ACFHU9_10735 [Fluviicola sp.]
MRKIGFIFSILLSNSLLFAQWDNLGAHGTNVQMVENSVGFKFANSTGPTPSSGTTYTLKSTQNDWQTTDLDNSGGGSDLGC